MTSSNFTLSGSDARLADFGSLLVFRHWLRCQLQDPHQHDPSSPAALHASCSTGLPQQSEQASERYGRLFF